MSEKSGFWQGVATVAAVGLGAAASRLIAGAPVLGTPTKPSASSSNDRSPATPEKRS